MKRMTVHHVIAVIIIAWIVVLLPYFIPALNVSARFWGIPFTVWIAIIAFAICLVINALAVHFTCETFDNVSDREEAD